MSLHWKHLSTPQKIEAVKAVYAPGMPGSQIASFFDGASRSAVISLYTRYPDALSATPLRAAQRTTQRVQRARRARQPAVKTYQPLPEPAFIPTEIHRCGKPLVMLARNECKWPVNDASGEELHLFCGSEAHGPYCGFHAGRAYRSPTSSS